MTGATVKEPALATTAPAARLQGVRKRFGYRDVLRGVCLEIPRGSCFVITGPNGAGKSTLVRILATQWTFTGGEVEVLGWSVRREPARIRSRLACSTIPSSGGATEELRCRRPPRPEARVALEQSLRSSSASVATGGGCRGTFARHDPASRLARSLAVRILILRAPFSSLDPPGRDLLAQAIREFSGAARTNGGARHAPDVPSRSLAPIPSASGGEGHEARRARRGHRRLEPGRAAPGTERTSAHDFPAPGCFLRWDVLRGARRRETMPTCLALPARAAGRRARCGIS
jgi:hypothetical protein